MARKARLGGRDHLVTPCKFIYPYFDNPWMLEFQVANWNRYDGELRDAVEIVLVDDHSSKPALPILRHCEVPVRAYRLLERFPWNMHECRNVGAKEACTAAQNAWLFLCDMDTVLEPEMARRMLTKALDPDSYYTMEALDGMDPTQRSPVSKNTLLVRHAAYWKVNGYDLDLTPVGGGGYGGARQFFKQLKQVVTHEHMNDVFVVNYSNIGDASTKGLDRKEWQLKFKEALKRKQESGDRRSLNPIRTEYARIL
jgi:hypothetical protein